MKSPEFLDNLRTAGLLLLATEATDPPRIVIRAGRNGPELPVQAVKVRNDKNESFIILEFDASLQYPTEDAYLRVCKASHWFQGQLKANDIEPIRITEDLPHYPPEDFKWPI